MSLPKWAEELKDNFHQDDGCGFCKLTEALTIAVEALEIISTDNGPDTVTRAKEALRRIEELGK